MQGFLIKEQGKSAFHTLFVFPRKYSLEEMRKAARARPGSYAHSIVDRLQRSIFVYPRDLIEEYQRYYIIEYQSFDSFLHWRYGIERSLAAKISQPDGQWKYVGYGIDHMGFLSDDTMAGVLETLLDAIEGAESEDTH